MSKSKYGDGHDKGRKAAKSDRKDPFSPISRVLTGYPERPSDPEGKRGFDHGYKGKKHK